MRRACAECHKAKNLVPESGGKPTKVGEKVLQLQRMLPLARVVYCSATGAPARSLMCWQQHQHDQLGSCVCQPCQSGALLPVFTAPAGGAHAYS